MLSTINDVYASTVAPMVAGHQQSQNSNILYSSKGYPYQNLLNKTQTGLIKIIYSESQDNVECSVELELDDLQLKSQSRTTTKDKFTQAPLASCLQRKQAKAWLKVLYK